MSNYHHGSSHYNWSHVAQDPTAALDFTHLTSEPAASTVAPAPSPADPSSAVPSVTPAHPVDTSTAGQSLVTNPVDTSHVVASGATDPNSTSASPATLTRIDGPIHSEYAGQV